MISVSMKPQRQKIPIHTKYIRTHIQNLMYELQLSKNVVGYTNSNLFYEMQ